MSSIPSGSEAVELIISADNDDIAELEDALSQLSGHGVYLRELNPERPDLRSDVWHTVVISLTSAGAAKLVKDVLVAYIQLRRIHVVVKREGKSTTIEYEGPLSKQEEIAKFVKEITIPEPPERVKS